MDTSGPAHVFVITYDLKAHRIDWESRRKLYDYIGDQDFCAITESSCLIATSMDASELSVALAKYLLSNRGSLFIARVEKECEIFLPIDERDRVKRWLNAHSLK